MEVELLREGDQKSLPYCNMAFNWFRSDHERIGETVNLQPVWRRKWGKKNLEKRSEARIKYLILFGARRYKPPTTCTHAEIWSSIYY